MNKETYERQKVLTEVYKKLLEAEEEVESGTPLLDGVEVLKNLRRKYISYNNQQGNFD